MDKPNGTYALGVFCTFVRPYVSGESRGISTQKKGFMKDFFDVILESSATDTSDVNKRHYSKAKTAINEGVWAGINQTDLVKFFNGCRKLPQWKASEFFQHLDKARVESLFDDIGIDALSQFQRCLGQVNIKAPSIDKLPSAVSTWLFEILEANADNRDLLVDGTAFQPEFELLDDLPLAEGHISSGKLHLGRSAVAWRKSPSPPESPDFNVERTYLAQMESAYAEHLHRQIRSRDDLPDRQRKEYDRQRGYFYNAEGLRRNMRDVIDDGETVYLTLVLETTVRAVEHGETSGSSVSVNAKFQGSGQCSQCIGDIMDTWDMKCNHAEIFTMMEQAERSTSFLVIGNFFCSVVFRSVHTIGDSPTFDTIGNFLRVLDLAV